MRREFSVDGIVVALLSLTALLGVLPPASGPALAQEVSKEQAAAMMLDGARRAYNEGKYDFAAQRFGEYIKTYGGSGSPNVRSAEYGLALCLLEAPQRDYKAISDLLRRSMDHVGSSERPFAAYHLGVCLRGLGNEALGQAAAKPPEAARYKAEAAQRFTEAAQQFAAAADTFTAMVKPPPSTAPADAPKEADWAARARCDQCDMILRTGKFAEAEALANAVLDHKVMGTGRYRDLALYHMGYACFAQEKHLEAGRALSQLAPFAQEFGGHAQYLLARTHHLAGERPEAEALYQAAPTAYEDRKKRAAEALRNPQTLRPEQKADLEALVRGPAPDYVLRASFYAAHILTEQGKYDEALTAFGALIQQHPKSPLVPEAQLRTGYCLMQAKRYPEAVKALGPLIQHPQLGDKAAWWTARAQVLAADPKNAQAYETVLKAAIATMGQAAESARQKGNTDPAAKARRGDILMELADTQQLLGQYKEAAGVYKQVIAEQTSPDCVEEAMQRQATSLHLAGMYRESDQVCQQFEQSYPRSTLLPAVLFRRAENAYFTASAAANDPNLKGESRRRRLEQLYGEVIQRYRHVIRHSPQFEYVNLARHGLATLYYQQERFAEAVEVLTKIPEFDRRGDLATASYLLADCLLREMPEESDDALGTARLVAHVDKAVKLLESFLGADPKDAKAPDALLKLAYCHQRIADVVTDNTERRNILMRAIAACDRVLKDFPSDPLVPMAVFERAKCMIGVHGPNHAVNELRRFQNDPYRKSRIAPLALARLSSLLRSQNRAAEAVGILAKYRAEHEPALLKDPDRSEWAAMLQYEHALAIKDSARPGELDKLTEARKMLEALIQQFPGRPEAVNAMWRASQCRREELAALLEAVRRASGSSKRDQLAALEGRLEETMVSLREGVGQLHAQALNEGKKDRGSTAHLQLLYETAWCYRVLAEGEIDTTRRKLQAEALAKARAVLAGRTPAGQTPPSPGVPEVPLSDIPVQPSEMNARRQYEALIAAAPTSMMAARVRFELAEMHMQRRDDPDSVAAAIKLLSEGVESNPTRELGETMRLRLASCLLARNEPKAALAHIEAIGDKPAGQAIAGQAQYLAAEALIQQGDWAKAIQKLLPFRDEKNYRSTPHGDRALLRLGQAQARAKQWDASRQTLQSLIQRNRNGRWNAEAYYVMGQTWQGQKQHDNAVQAYTEVIRRTVGEAAAKAQFGIGQCRLEQKKYPEAVKELLLVPLTYGYPQWSAAARYEAARAYAEMKDLSEAARLYREVVKDDPASRWAKLAQERLNGIEQ